MKKLIALATLAMSSTVFANDIADAATSGVTALSATVTALGVIAVGIAVAFAVARVTRKAVNKV